MSMDSERLDNLSSAVVRSNLETKDELLLCSLLEIVRHLERIAAAIEDSNSFFQAQLDPSTYQEWGAAYKRLKQFMGKS